MQVDAQAIAKFAKAAFAIAALFGVNISPEDTQKILDAVLIIFSLIYAYEGRVKQKEAQAKNANAPG